MVPIEQATQSNPEWPSHHLALMFPIVILGQGDSSPKGSYGLPSYYPWVLIRWWFHYGSVFTSSSMLMLSVTLFLAKVARSMGSVLSWGMDFHSLSSSRTGVLFSSFGWCNQTSSVSLGFCPNLSQIPLFFLLVRRDLSISLRNWLLLMTREYFICGHSHLCVQSSFIFLVLQKGKEQS